MPKSKGEASRQLPAVVPEERPGRVGGKRDQNRRARTLALIEAALPLFLERGVEAVRIDDITRAAGVAKGSFYRYFPDKESMVAHLLVGPRERVLSAFERCEERIRLHADAAQVRPAYTRLGRELAATLLQAPQVARLYLQERGAPPVGARAPIAALERDIQQRALRLNEAVFELGLLRRVHPEVSTLAVFGAAERLLSAYFRGQLSVDPTVAIQDLVTIVVEGMRREPGSDE